MLLLWFWPLIQIIQTDKENNYDQEIAYSHLEKLNIREKLTRCSCNVI